MSSATRLVVGLCLIVLFAPGVVRADDPTKVQFKTVKMQELAKTGYDEALNKQGAEGWEVCTAGQESFLFRKDKAAQKWEYKAVNTRNSPFVTLADTGDVDTFNLMLTRMKAEAWTPCALSALGDFVIFKRLKRAEGSPGKAEKAEFQTLLWKDVTKTGPEYEKLLLESLNKQGAEGWEVCLCDFRSAVAFQKSQASQKWEYKLVKVSNSPLASFYDKTKADEEAAFTLILEGLEADGWKPCAVDRSSPKQNVLVKRSKSDEGPAPKKEKKD